MVVVEETRAKTKVLGGFRLAAPPSVFDSVAPIGVICGAGRNYIIIPFAPATWKTNESTIQHNLTPTYTTISTPTVTFYILCLPLNYTVAALYLTTS